MDVLSDDEILPYLLVRARVDCLVLKRLLPQVIEGNASERVRIWCEGLVRQLDQWIGAAIGRESSTVPDFNQRQHVADAVDRLVKFIEGDEWPSTSAKPLSNFKENEP